MTTAPALVSVSNHAIAAALATKRTEQPDDIRNIESEAFDLNDFCTAYNISNSTARRLVRSGALHARKIGTKIYILKTDARAWWNSLPAVEPVAA